MSGSAGDYLGFQGIFVILRKIESLIFRKSCWRWLEVNLDFAEYLEAELEDGRTIVIPCFPWKCQSELTGRYNIC